jgi:glycosyltransferase involved in cell wall biosynthesis
MRLALVHDYLCGKGGSERVFQYMCEEFPEADAFALACNPPQTYPYFATREVRTTYLNPIVRSMDAFRWSFPLATYAMEGLDLSEYDVVLSSSATVGKYVHVPNGRHICYCYIPTRAIWHFEQYFGSSLKGMALRGLLPYLRKRDLQAASRVDRFVAISKSSQDYIREFYGRDADVLYCPIDLSMFYSRPKKDHYLIVSRLEKWKMTEYAIEAFNTLGYPLRVIGTGNEERHLRRIAKSNITFLGSVDDERLALEYSEARAVVFTPFLEYGLIPLEANASGTPVICYGKGGVTETLIPEGDPREETPTAVFFDEQTPASLIDAVRRFERCTFDPSSLMKHAAAWGVPSFKQRLHELVEAEVAQRACSVL